MIAPRSLDDPDDTVAGEAQGDKLEQGKVAAAIDIGSNSIKMTVARSVHGGGLEQVAWTSEVVRLGEGLDETGKLDDERMDLAVAAIARFADEARALGASVIVAVATEATRAAANGREFLDRVRQETGVDVRVIDGLEEAELTFRGLAATMILTGTVVIADVGGGSTELIVTGDGAMQSAQSIPLGSGRLTARCIHNDPPHAAELEICEVTADDVLRAAVRQEPLPSEARLIVVGGTGEFLTRLVPDEQAIDVGAVRSALAKMTVLTAAELADAIEAPEARARVLPAGVTIVAALAKLVRPERIEVARSGVRAGLLLEAFADDRGPKTASLRDSNPSEIASPGAAPASAKAGSNDHPPPERGFREAMKALIGERWQAVWEAIPAALDGADIEGVHDVRVASRRLRAAMDTAAPVFPKEWYRRLHRTAKEITSELGEVRDRDVLLEALRRDRENAPLAERPGIDRLIARVEHERSDARTEMERYLHELMTGSIVEEIERRFGGQNATPNGSRAANGRE